MLIVVYFINLCFQIFTVMIFVRILASWVPQVNQYRIMQFVAYYTDPYLNLFRKIIPPLGMFDISPIVAFIALRFIQNMLVNTLLHFA